MLHPALEVRGVESSLVLAVADDYSPTAAEDIPNGIRIFFLDAARRHSASRAIADAWPDAALESLDVDDEDWARRSQENLPPITVGRLTIRATDFSLQASAGHRLLKSEAGSLQPAVSSARHGRGRSLPGMPARPALPALVIIPSTGFGTGHHWTTRFCLQALQEIDLTDKTVLDVGTGSGILAIAARLLGARDARGIDNDPDALDAARDNLSRNAGVEDVTFELVDLSAADVALPLADVVTANLTGVLLRQTAGVLMRTLRPGGVLILSGILTSERDEVARAFADLEFVSDADDEEWAGLVFRRRPR